MRSIKTMERSNEQDINRIVTIHEPVGNDGPVNNDKDQTIEMDVIQPEIIKDTSTTKIKR